MASVRDECVVGFRLVRTELTHRTIIPSCKPTPENYAELQRATSHGSRGTDVVDLRNKRRRDAEEKSFGCAVCSDGGHLLKESMRVETAQSKIAWELSRCPKRLI